MRPMSALIAIAALLLTACSPAAPPAPTAAPAKPAATAPPAAAAAPATKSGPLPAANIEPLATRTKLKLAPSPQVISYLPLYYAIDKGYFQKAGLDIELKNFTGSALTQLPLLLRGDLDISGMVPGAGLYNQMTQGFNVQVIAGFDIPKQGRASPLWLMVPNAKANQIKEVKDIKKGMIFEAAREGTPISLLALEAIRQAGLTKGTDVTVQYKTAGPAEMLALAQSNSVDVQGVTDPLATQLQNQGIAVKWKTFVDLAPWYQGILMAASDRYLQQNRPAVVKFLEVYVAAAREVNAMNGQWTDDVVNKFAKVAEMEAKTIRDQGAIPYFEPNGRALLDSLEKTQDFLIRENQLKDKIEIQKMVDQKVLDEALQKVGSLS